jgi:hypothetical protein
MLGLRTAIQAVREARLIASPSPPVGTMPNAPLSPMARLRADILQEQERREKFLAENPIEKLCEQPAIYETEGEEPCALPMTPNPTVSNE